MAIRTVKPTSPARRYMTFVTNDEITKTTPEKSLLSPKRRTQRAQRLRAHHRPPSGRRAQAHAPRGRLPPREARHPGAGGGDRVRPEPLGAHRAAALPRRREALHHRAARAQAGRHGHVGPAGRHPARQRAADPQHPARHARAQRRAAAGQGRPALPQRGHPGPAPGQGRRPRQHQAALGRGAAGQARLHGHHRPGRQPRPRERVHRQGGPGALEGIPPDRARHGHEPRRPPDGRRRGQGQGQPPDDAVGQADQGLQDAARAPGRRTATSSRAGRNRSRGTWDAR